MNTHVVTAFVIFLIFRGLHSVGMTGAVGVWFGGGQGGVLG